MKQTIFQFATKNLKNRPILFYLDEKSVVLLSSIINSNYLNSFGSRSSTHAESSQLRMQFMRNVSALIWISYWTKFKSKLCKVGKMYTILTRSHVISNEGVEELEHLRCHKKQQQQGEINVVRKADFLHLVWLQTPMTVLVYRPSHFRP